MNRRDFLWSGAAAIAIGTGATLRIGGAKPALATETFEITKTDAEWHAILSDAAFDVLRREGTEYPGTSPLLNEHRKGIFACAGCDLPVYPSETKFDSGTGWPSFWQEIANAIGKTEDRSLGMTRTEVHCRRCGGHLGHVFDDGPPPTGLRHCINGVALSFKPAAA
ncbi:MULTISPECIES: peptide-methionine (R)-S-oxide reductase MsrB [unclassified Mesorhizobium]|uniref:peptide-methionine (R)-S-oxide reductase MsrB n=1 Tax=unclassified Mesorhizobium TaxID=325217 RepID=UPI000BB0AD7F|nr:MULTISPECIES: peptide-methionine (R)-S-oxide reductase MsrB [unclassified Mesorhizobium]TGT60526.1 peptide-methionine (R)-S-oxide reductase [Mesorhizobium sp. M00.F.Ca.ET.170.01.1.1]AZO10371.1 peptide-methionine (R)-S-oxide reductase [Mesorhizobium sp. M3A.F.Ca.ET.080.04.2.1]PBB87895.1 peptide-methionine (R)-S-oxide reductase [Mesorhizobium sp. WSM3876]RWB73633.1 MAG: peptide-methionine (R)-S-oxide reductase [Mesorhizobium sp.]RWB91810.1 MAG: peptide-methionine (R)-S-oxide reductase [Mesorh